MTIDSPYIPLDGTFRGLTQSLHEIWNERNPDNALHGVLNSLLRDLAAHIVFEEPITAAISVHDEKRNRLRIEAAIGPLADELQAHPPRTTGVAAHVYRHRTSLIVPAIEQWPNSVPSLHPALLRHNEVRAVAMYPLLIGTVEQDSTIGVLTLLFPQQIKNNAYLESALRGFAERSAFVTQASRVHRRHLREEQALIQISQAAANGDPETLSKEIARQAVTLTQSAYAVVFVASRDQSQLNSMDVVVAAGSASSSSSITLPLAERSINAHVYRIQHSYYAKDLADDLHHFHFAKWDDNTRSAYCVPLKMQDMTVGTLYVANHSLDGFTKRDQDFIDQLAFHAASALRSTRLLQHIVHFQQVISDVHPINEQFTHIREELQRLGFDTSGLLIASYSHEEQTIDFPYVWEKECLVAEHDLLRTPGQRYSHRTLGARGGLVDWVIRRRTPLLVKDFSHWSSQQQFELDEYGDLTCCLFVPMFRHERIVGVLGLRSYAEPNLFSEYDRQFLEVAANHIAVVIENAATFSREIRQIDFHQAVREIQENIADTLPLPEQMSQFRAELQRLGINTSGLFIATVDPETQMIELPKLWDKGNLVLPEEKQGDSPFAPRPVGYRHGLIDWCIQNKPRSILVPNFHEWDHRDEIEPDYAKGITCFLMAPMYHNQKLVGIIGLRGYERPHMFDRSHQELLTAIADFMAIVVENAQIYDRSQRDLETSNQQLQRRLQVWEALSDYQRDVSDISEQEQEVENIWDSMRRALEKINVDPGSLYLALLQDGQITFPRVFEEGRPAARPERSPEHPYRDRPLGTRADLSEFILKKGEPLHLRNRHEIERFGEEQPQLDYIPQYSQSWLGVPIKKGDHIFGMIGLRSFHEENAFDKPLEEFMAALASHAAIVLENAQLFEDVKYEASTTKALATAGRLIASAGLETNRVLQTILQQAVEVTGAVFGTLQLVKDTYLETVAVYPYTYEHQVLAQIERISIEEGGITGRAARHNDAQLVPDVTQDPDYITILPSIRSQLSVVLRDVHKKMGRPIGVITVEHEKMGGVTIRHRQLLIDLSRSAAVSIDYAHQYQALERARDIGLASTAIAWLGLFGADWQHTINQKTFSISNYVAGLKLHLQRIEQMTSNSSFEEPWTMNRPIMETLRDGLQRIQNVADEIREVRFTRQVQLPHSLTEGLSIDSEYDQAASTSSGSCLIDAELPEMVNSWCRKQPLVEVCYQLQAPYVRVGIAAQWLKVAMEKLVNNAIDVMPDGGRLTIQTSVNQEEIRISILDTGPGIPESIRHYFLKRVIPKEEKEAGSGMGAMIARFVALSHGGNLELIQKESQKGAELLMTLPILFQ